MNGMLQHEYDVNSEDIYWFIGGLNSPAPRPLIPLNLTEKIKLEFLSAGETLEGMLENGELDALFALYVPALFQSGSPRVMRLFPNYKEVEQDYYRRTRIFPIMHTVVVRDDVYREHPWVAQSLYKAFREARDLAVNGLYDTDALRLSLPWLISYVEETWQVFGKTSGVTVWSRIVRRWKRSASMCTSKASRRAPSDPRSSLRRTWSDPDDA